MSAKKIPKEKTEKQEEPCCVIGRWGITLVDGRKDKDKDQDSSGTQQCRQQHRTHTYMDVTSIYPLPHNDSQKHDFKIRP